MHLVRLARTGCSGILGGARPRTLAAAAVSILLLLPKRHFSAHAFQPPSNATPQCHARGRHYSSMSGSNGGEVGVSVGGSCVDMTHLHPGPSINCVNPQVRLPSPLMFGPYKIDEDQVFYSSRLTMAIVNLKPIVSARHAANPYVVWVINTALNTALTHPLTPNTGARPHPRRPAPRGCALRGPAPGRGTFERGLLCVCVCVCARMNSPAQSSCH